MSEVEETLERVKNHKGVEGYIIADKHGAVLRRHPLMNQDDAERYAISMKDLTVKARGVVRDLYPKNELQILRLRLKKQEVMVAHGKAYVRYFCSLKRALDKDFLVIVIQQWSPSSN